MSPFHSHKGAQVALDLARDWWQRVAAGRPVSILFTVPAWAEYPGRVARRTLWSDTFEEAL